MPAVLAIIKESVGFVGAVALALPWLRDFAGRRKTAVIDQSRFAGSLKALASEIVYAQETWLAKPKPFDLLATVLGLALLATAFAIGLVQAIVAE